MKAPSDNVRADVIDAIAEVVRDRLSDARIVDVSVAEDVDHDGDDILRVEVVFEAEGDRLDPSRVRGLIRHIRSRLAGLHEDRFPMMSFQTPRDVEGRSPEAA